MSTVKSTVKKTPKKKASNTGFGKSGRKSMLKNAAKVLVPKEDKITKKALKEKMKEMLSPQEEYFCELYVSDIEFYGNGTQSYIEAFDITVVKGKSRNDTDDNEMTYETVRANASKLLTKSNILNRINDLMEAGGFNDQHADKTLTFLMTQRADLRVALGAIDAYNKLQARIHEKSTLVHQFANEDMTDAELMQRIQKNTAFFKKE